MTKHEAIRQTHQENTLMSLGFTRDEAESLRRISMTLQRWFEMECGTGNGQVSYSIERDGENGDGRPFMRIQYPASHGYHDSRRPIADREAGARKRLENIVKARNERHVRHTSCDRCGLDIEGLAPFTEWRDRGNNAGDEYHRHAPAASDVEHLPLSAYIQGDPRGAALYILRPGDVPDGKTADSYYTRGICVY